MKKVLGQTAGRSTKVLSALHLENLIPLKKPPPGFLVFQRNLKNRLQLFVFDSQVRLFLLCLDWSVLFLSTPSIQGARRTWTLAVPVAIFPCCSSMKSIFRCFEFLHWLRFNNDPKVPLFEPGHRLFGVIRVPVSFYSECIGYNIVATTSDAIQLRQSLSKMFRFC